MSDAAKCPMPEDVCADCGHRCVAAPEKTIQPFSRLVDGLTIAVGCNNIFDRVPPHIDGANNNTDLTAYDPYGRFLYFEVSKKF